MSSNAIEFVFLNDGNGGWTGVAGFVDGTGLGAGIVVFGGAGTGFLGGAGVCTVGGAISGTWLASPSSGHLVPGTFKLILKMIINLFRDGKTEALIHTNYDIVVYILPILAY